MLKASLRLYKNAYSGLPVSMWWLALVMFINRSGTMVIPFLTVYLTGRGFSLQEAGYVMAAFGTGAIVGGWLGGQLTDRFGHLPIQVSSLMMNGILFIILGKMESFWEIAICIFVLGSLGEAFRPANSAAIAAYSDETNRTRCYSLNRLAINAGWAVGPAVGGFLAQYSYDLLFWADGITCMSASALLLIVFRHERKRQIKHRELHQIKTVKKASRDGLFMLGMLYIFLVGLCFFQMFSILPVYYKEVVGLTESTIGWLLAMNGIIIVMVEMILVYTLEPRKRAVQFMALGCLLIGIAFLMLSWNALLVMVTCSMIVITFGEMLLFPFMNNFWVNRSNDENRGQYAGIYTMSFSAAIVLAPNFASKIVALSDYTTLWQVNFMVCLLAAIGFYLLKKRMPHE